MTSFALMIILSLFFIGYATSFVPGGHGRHKGAAAAKTITPPALVKLFDSPSSSYTTNINNDQQTMTITTTPTTSSTTKVDDNPPYYNIGDSDEDMYSSIGSIISDALDQMNIMMDNIFMEEFPAKSLQKLFHTCKESVEVKVSTIPNAGRGLFASKDIPAGQIVTFYPVHTMGVCLPSGGGTYSIQQHQDRTTLNESRYIVTVEEEEGKDSTISTDNEDSSYMLHLIGGRSVMGVDLEHLSGGGRPYVDIDLKRPILNGWMGHFINDGAVVTKPNDTTYYEKSLQAQNCILAPFGPAPIIVAVTTKPVQQGEELFTSYFYRYWAGALGSNDNHQQGGAISTSEEIRRQEEVASEEVMKAMMALEVPYEEEWEAFEGAFDAFLNTRQNNNNILMKKQEQEQEPQQNENITFQTNNPSRRWLLSILQRFNQRHWKNQIWNKVFRRGGRNKKNPQAFGQ